MTIPLSDHSAPATAHPGNSLQEAALLILHQGEQLLSLVPAPVYVLPSDLVFNASIGGHYRHCLDHFSSFLRGLVSGVIDYDQRERDPAVERERDAARALTQNLRDHLAAVSPTALQLPVRVCGAVSYGPERAPATESSAARELAYVIAHAIHHFALIAVIARLNGLALPADFGLAPSTLTHRRREFAPSHGATDAFLAR